MHPSLTIGALAKAAGVGVETVRFYQRRGLLETPPKGPGYRTYGQRSVDRLRFIKRAQTLGFTLDEIQELLALDDLNDHRLARLLAQEKIGAIRTRIASLERMVGALNQLLRECEHGDGKLPCPIIRLSLAD